VTLSGRNGPGTADHVRALRAAAGSAVRRKVSHAVALPARILSLQLGQTQALRSS